VSITSHDRFKFITSSTGISFPSTAIAFVILTGIIKRSSIDNFVLTLTVFPAANLSKITSFLNIVLS